MINQVTKKIMELPHQPSLHEMAIGYLRYEELRKLNPREFKALWDTNIKEDITFNDLVDQLVFP